MEDVEITFFLAGALFDSLQKSFRFPLIIIHFFPELGQASKLVFSQFLTHDSR